MSFKEFGEKVGVATDYKWENGIAEPNVESLDKIIKAFNLDEDYFDIRKD